MKDQDKKLETISFWWDMMIITTSAECSERRWDAARGSIGISLHNYNMEETQVELSGQ